ncbi:unnamed protein product [Adineta ricciae]|uniref:Uncharacterized protein n=1 Tax=Adineta ricciae TaxID=249248 RepID=A0A814UQX8_ADIRI|nr:unnamed protein product [Adineta ricciae]CAF1180730.1 unnamed protein product [Adineta ricciae]
MNRSNVFLNDILATTATTIRPKRDYYVTNPFDSWYVGGLLFMCTIMLVLLYANYYRENSCQECWFYVLKKLGFTQTLPAVDSRASINHRNNPPLLV